MKPARRAVRAPTIVTMNSVGRMLPAVSGNRSADGGGQHGGLRSETDEEESIYREAILPSTLCNRSHAAQRATKGAHWAQASQIRRNSYWPGHALDSMQRGLHGPDFS